MKTKVCIILCCAIYAGGVVGSAVAENRIDQASKPERTTGIVNHYFPYLQLQSAGYKNGHKVQGSTEASLFLPLMQSITGQHLVFSHFRFFDRTGSTFEGNGHIGYRYYNATQEHIYGLYGAWDRKRSDYSNYYNQLTLGMEGWFKKLFIGGNIYCPIGKKSHLLGTTEQAKYNRVQNNIWLTIDSHYEKVLHGGDSEVGYELSKGMVGYVGGYYFRAPGVAHIYGPKIRLSYDWFPKSNNLLNIIDKIGLDIGVQRDSPRGTTCYIGVNLRFGICPNKHRLGGILRHMVDLPRRDPDIVANTGKQSRSEVYRDRSGQEIKLTELVGDENGIINTEEFRQALQDNSLQIILVHGHIATLPADMVSPTLVKGNKELIFTRNFTVVSPYTKKLLNVILEPTNSQGKASIGSLSASVLATLKKYSTVYSENLSFSPAVDTSDKTRQGREEKITIDTLFLQESSLSRVEKQPEEVLPQYNPEFGKDQTSETSKNENTDTTKRYWNNLFKNNLFPLAIGTGSIAIVAVTSLSLPLVCAGMVFTIRKIRTRTLVTEKIYPIGALLPIWQPE